MKKNNTELKTSLFCLYSKADVIVKNDAYIGGGYNGKIIGISEVLGVLVEHQKGGDNWEHIESCTLELVNPLKISNKDIIDIADRTYSKDGWSKEIERTEDFVSIKREKSQFKIVIHKTGIVYSESNQLNFGGGDYVFIYDMLRAKNIATKFLDIELKKLLEFGWISFKN